MWLKAILRGMLLFTVSGVGGHAQSRHYPEIVPLRASYVFGTTMPKAEKHLMIRNQTGLALYELRVFAISDDNRTTSMLELHLYSAQGGSLKSDEKFEPNLLNPDRWGHGEGDWIIRPSQICDPNKHNAPCKAVRIFTLRRMRIVVAVIDVTLNQDSNAFTSVGLRINVRHSSSRRSRPR